MHTKKISLVLLILIVAFFACKEQKNKTDGITFQIGTWELVSRIDRTVKDSIIKEPSLGDNPLAILIYDTLNNVAVQIMKRDRKDSMQQKISSSNSNNSSAFNGYDAYFGKYEIDTIRHQVKHTLIGTINPKDVGKTIIRNYILKKDTLYLWFNTTNNNIAVKRTLTWVKAKK
jgi:hypothetical protein